MACRRKAVIYAGRKRHFKAELYCLKIIFIVAVFYL
jgi:hypothetical protein